MDALLGAFLDSVGSRGELEVASLAPALHGILQGAHAAYPGVSLEEATFGRHLGDRVGSERPLGEALARLRGTDLFLACACLQGDVTAVNVFEKDFLRPAAAALVRRGQPSSDVEDAAQELSERLFVTGCKLREYSGLGSLTGWVRISLARQCAGSLRKLRAADAVGDESLQIARVDPDLAVLRRRYAGTFQLAFQDAFARLAPEERNILRMHFVDGLNLDRMAPMLGMSRATAGRRMLDAKRALLAHLVALAGERLEATPSEVASLLTIVRSTLFGSLAGLLRRD